MSGLSPKARVDLHMHSNRSDGRYSAEEVLRRALLGGLDVLALTDHDLAPGLAPGLWKAGDRTLHVVHGAELSGTHEGRELHLLVYFPGQMPASFVDFCTARAQYRARRYADAVVAIGEPALRGPDAQAIAGERSLTRLHLAQALVDAGIATSWSHAFTRWAGESAGILPPFDLSFVEAISVARAAGAFTSWAHPDPDDAQRWAGVFAAAGLHALEALRPGIGRGVRDTLSRLAHKHGMSVTGGSDWHGWQAGELGAFSVPARQLDPFLRAVGLD